LTKYWPFFIGFRADCHNWHYRACGGQQGCSWTTNTAPAL